MKEQILKIFFPPRCGICDEPVENRGDLCPECAADSLRIKPPVCTNCGREKNRCTCALTTHKGLSVGAPFYYENEVRTAVLKFKLSGQLHRRQTFAAEMARFISERWAEMKFDVIVPVPMSKKGKRKRGFDPVGSLAEELSRITGIPLYRAVIKQRDTKLQRSLKASLRKANVYDAFAVVQDVKEKTVLLVDDVITTGSTVSEVGKILREAGCRDVCACSIALTPATTVPGTKITAQSCEMNDWDL